MSFIEEFKKKLDEVLDEMFTEVAYDSENEFIKKQDLAQQTVDIRWLWRHAGHDDDIETLEEYNKKMIELQEKYLKEEK